MLLGVTLGFAAATSNSIAYLFSRAFLQKHDNSYFHLLAVSHIIMGVLALIVTPFFWPENMPAFSSYAPYLAGASLFYFVAQAFLFLALKNIEASRLSPLLGSKIIMIALISVIFLDKSYNGLQWIAIFLTFVAAVLLTGAGPRAPFKAVAFTMITCFGYCLSDLSIIELLKPFESMGVVRSAIFTAGLSYIICGIVSIPLFFLLSPTPREMFKDAIPFSLLWFTAMLCLFGCFGSLGVIYGNIVQSTRGVISVVIAAFVAMAGLISLEQKVSTYVLVKRICAAVLMSAAIAIFHLQRNVS